MTSSTLNSLNWADYTIIGIIALSCIISLVRGFVREAMSLVIWGLAFWIGIKFSVQLAEVFVGHINTPSLRLIISFACLFFAALIIGGLISYLISQLVDKTGLSGTDRMVGVVFGLARGVLLIAVLVMLGDLAVFSQDTWWKSSTLIPHFQGLAHWLRDFLPEQFNQLSNLIPKST